VTFSPDGKDFELMGRSACAAATPELKAELLAIISKRNEDKNKVGQKKKTGRLIVHEVELLDPTMPGHSQLPRITE